MKSELRASTLVELLVTMIVAGITILAIMDGINIIAAVHADRVRRLHRYGERIEGFYRLDELLGYADSLACGEYGVAEIWKDGRRMELFSCDSLLICRAGDFSDTLLHEIAGMRMSADSLFVDISDTLALSFTMPVAKTTVYNRRMDLIERNFGYEEDNR